MKTIIVACGGGIATAKINGRLEDMGLAGKAKAEAVDIKSLDMFINNADLYISVTPMARGQQEYPIPTVSGIPFLTGIGAEQAMQQIVELLKL